MTFCKRTQRSFCMLEKQNQLKASGGTYADSKNWTKAGSFLQSRTTVALKKSCYEIQL